MEAYALGKLGLLFGIALGAALFWGKSGRKVAGGIFALFVIALIASILGHAPASPEEIRAGFMQGCLQGCSTTPGCSDICSCVFETMHAGRSDAEVSRLVHRASTDITPELRAELEGYVRQCARK